MPKREFQQRRADNRGLPRRPAPKAVEKALDYVSINNVEFDVAANAGAKYLEDYDLGDKCDIIIDAILASYQARIIEVLETWNQGVHKVTLVFGDKIPTQYEKARLR